MIGSFSFFHLSSQTMSPNAPSIYIAILNKHITPILTIKAFSYISDVHDVLSGYISDVHDVLSGSLKTS